METNLNEAIKVSKKLNWMDIVGDPSKITVENMWRIYAGLIFDGKEISAIQYQETKKAYFIGFSECFKIMTDISEKYDEGKASEILSRIARESNEYIESAIQREMK